MGGLHSATWMQVATGQRDEPVDAFWTRFQRETCSSVMSLHGAGHGLAMLHTRDFQLQACDTPAVMHHADD